jgi:hypothetical protein
VARLGAGGDDAVDLKPQEFLAVEVDAGDHVLD